MKYFEDGAIETETNYLGGKLNGSYRIYYRNGKLKEEGILNLVHDIIAKPIDVEDLIKKVTNC